MSDLENNEQSPPRLTQHVVLPWMINAGGVVALVVAGWWVATTRPLP